MAKNAHRTLMEDYHLLSYDVLDSTNEEAKRLAQGGGAHGAAIWAKKQSSGRGRMGRSWISAEGNLFVTLLLQPQVKLEQCAQLSFVASLAVADTLEAIVPDPHAIRCKWPNDVLCAGRKLAGILLESFTTPQHAGVHQWVAVGVGINVDSAPEHVMFPATCLRESGVELISAKIVLSRFIHHFIHRYDEWMAKGFAPIKKAWEARGYHLGDAVEVLVGETQYEGVFEGIDTSGQLILGLGGKKRMPIIAGDVFYKETV